MDELIAVVDAAGRGVPVRHHWSKVVGAGRANEGLRADWQEHLALVAAECGFEYVRFHGLFHDDMFVCRVDADGTAHYNFQYVDALFDRLLELGVRPFVEFGFCPGDLAREKATVFWWGAHGSPPKDLGRWCELVERTVCHWITRYGIDEVASWYFEVWNEPNLKPFFAGSRSEYFALYAATARTLKALDPRLRVGGPSTSNFVPDARFDGETEDLSCHTIAGPDVLDALDWQPVWVEWFLRRCHDEGVPVDFVSCHPYPTDWALDEHGQGAKLTRDVEATPCDLALVRKLVEASRFPEAEIHLTEWSSSSSSRDFTHDTLPAATFVVRAMTSSLGVVDSLAYWTFTDVFEEVGAGETLFHGGFGMVTLPGIVKPTFHAFRMLHALGDRLLHRSEGLCVTRNSRTGALAAIAYVYPPEVTRSVPASFSSREVADRTAAIGLPRVLELTLTGLVPADEVRVEILDDQAGDALSAWRAVDCPAEPTREQVRVLRAAARATKIEFVRADAAGTALVRRELRPWSVVLVTTGPARSSGSS
ncbi:GH39 family glycosyl hydrolase [Amycolatopsis sp. CA-126428]|uniref:GH39 family glycosyl hydrolase n=1 Tax=Amycolatopsis sp. CA-126428 TaxID=2073158 RepID=UPI000CD2B929|nr:beta-xylosidase [Amycolatopsis sp. CA-126428]